MRRLHEKILVQAGKALLKRANDVAGLVRYQTQSPVSYAIGATMLRDLLHGGNERISKIYVVSTEKVEARQEQALALARERGIPVEHDKRYARVWGNNSRHTLVGEFEKWDDRIMPGSHVVCVNPSLWGNVGGIMRSTLAFGVHDMAIIKEEFDTFHPAVVRGSMGARLDMRVEVFSTLEDYCARFPENNRYAFMIDAAQPLASVEKRAPYSLIFGNETLGLAPELAQICQPVFIEQTDEIDSLNVAVSAAIALREFALATA